MQRVLSSPTKEIHETTIQPNAGPKRLILSAQTILSSVMFKLQEDTDR